VAGEGAIAIATLSNVVLINHFEVPEGQEEAFLAGWQAAADHLLQAPGFISTRLHKSLDSAAKFRIVNVAEWASPQHFEAVVRSEAFAALRSKLSFIAYPALYTVAVNDPPS
jgi:heme oxygenase (mycobilin-producing)